MQIILLRQDKGRAQTLWIPNAVLYFAAALLVVGLLSTSYLIHRYFAQDLLPTQVVVSWQERLERQRIEIEDMQAQTRAEAAAVGRRMASMQARLLRMEALGERLTELAAIDKAEFRFDQPAALGGPDEGQDFFDGLLYATAVDQLAQQVRAREAELSVLESLLAERRFTNEVSLAGRPVERGWMSSSFGRRADPFSGRMTWHAGVDFAGPEGGNVLAVGGGIVVFAGRRGGYGKMIEINHGGGYVTRYAHHSEILVDVGDIVKKGDTIAKIGATGRATGPHVHFEVLKDGRPIDPQRYIARSRQG